jgi:hypothetical protein
MPKTLASLIAALALILTLPATPVAAQQAQRVCSVQIVATGPRRVGEERAREAAIAEFDAHLIRNHGAVNPFTAARGLSERTVAVTCRRDNARQTCTASGHVCVLTRAAPACAGPQRIDAEGLHDTCTVNLSSGGGFMQPSISGSGAFPTVRIPCPRGYQVRVRAGQDTCMLPGY